MAMNDADRDRFRKLLTLAAESPFAGEREAALIAAERLATRNGLSLDEAARGFTGSESSETESRRRRPRDEQRSAWMHNVYSHYAYDAAASRARQQHRKNVEAEQRAEEQRQRDQRSWSRQFRARSRQRIPPLEHARILMQETRFPLREISTITGVSMHDLVGLKLKLREAS